MKETQNLTEKPGYYAIIPANVRYDKRLSPAAKLLYGEITCLLQFNNRCFASNNYFARLYEISEVQVSRLVKQLIDANYVFVEMENTNVGSRRLIKLAFIKNDDTPIIKNDEGGTIKNVKHINHSINKNLLSKDKRTKAKFIKPTVQEVKDYFEEKGYSSETAKKAFDYYEVADWKDSSGKPVLNWKQKMISNWFKKDNKTVIDSQERIKF